MAASLRIAYVTPEMAPLASTGGLGDVSGALPKALARLGHEVTVFLPRYGRIPFPPGKLRGAVHVPVDALPRSAEFYEVRPEEGLRLVFVEHPAFFDRPQLYGIGNDDYPDNPLRFAFLCRAALEYYRSRGEPPDVFHVHDWQTAMLPVYLKAFYWDDATLRRTPAVLTIHNMAYQGIFPRETLATLGLPAHLATAEALEFYGRISYLKGGLLFSEMLTTVSPQYAREIQDAKLGCGLQDTVRSRAKDLVGILNGVDYDTWDPSLDVHIARRYSAQDLSGKRTCKADLLRSFSLPTTPDWPVVGVVSRLVAQKGLDLLLRAGSQLLRRPVRLAILGTGDPVLEQGFRDLAAMAPERVATRFAYDTALAHKVVAGADMLVMPSRFEPCGLFQLYGLRYGTVPIVRATGGLVDSVEPYDAGTGEGTGFRFEAALGTGLLRSLDRALATYQNPRSWQRLMRNGMSRNFSWERSAQGYVEVYQQARERV